ncbi:MAG: hypothetical protein ACTHNQ_18215 [Microbacterium sp.]|uniref:hypothetical protein n=1 Tax=Microbacterium sp. TaxID=51671 RepID=UPI003F80790D
MRSLFPDPGNPWPHDMVITVEDRPHALLELLWVREAYGLRVEGDDLPPLLTDTPEPVAGVTERMRTEWEQAWPRVWRAAAAHEGRDDASRLIQELQRSALGSRERWELLQQLTGPSWRDEVGDAVFDDGFREWDQRGHDRVIAAMHAPAPIGPERRDLDDLIAAWRAGLTKVVTIPCVGEFDRRLSPTALLTTDAARADSDSYRRALRAFV